MIVLYIIGVYLIGFFVTLTFLKFFGKALKLDTDHYEWKSNEEGYTVLSCIWFITILVFGIKGIVKLPLKFTKWYLKL
jgi:hypothetical protein